MTEPIATTGVWNIYQLRNGRKIKLLRPELSVALAASRFQLRIATAQLRAHRASPPEPAHEPHPATMIAGGMGAGKAHGHKQPARA